MKLKKDFGINRGEFINLKKSFLNSPLCPRIICLLVHGSSLYYHITGKDRRDIDLELVLDSPQKDDYLVIKNILDKNKSRIECQLRYLREITSKESLIHTTAYKMFMFFAYSNAHCLIGHNIYKKLVQEIPEDKIRQSILISMQIAFKDIRKSFFAGCDAYVVNKNIIRTLVCVCMYENLLDYKKLGEEEFFNQESEGFIELISKKYLNYLSLSETDKLKNFAKHYQERKLFMDIFPVMEKIVEIFEKRITV